VQTLFYPGSTFFIAGADRGCDKSMMMWKRFSPDVVASAGRVEPTAKETHSLEPA